MALSSVAIVLLFFGMAKETREEMFLWIWNRLSLKLNDVTLWNTCVSVVLWTSFFFFGKLGYLCNFVQSPDAHTFFGVSMLMRMLQQFCTCVKNYAHTSRIEEWNFLFVFVPGTICMAVYCFCCQLLRCAACLCAVCACAFHKWKKSKNGTFELKNKKQ